MFKLPSNSISYQKIRTYSSSFLDKKSKGQKSTSKLLFDKKCLSFKQSLTERKSRQKSRPLSSHSRICHSKKQIKKFPQFKQIQFGGYLFSPCNQNLTSFISQQKMNGIDLQMNTQDYLLEPRNISGMRFLPSSLNKPKLFSQSLPSQKYQSPYTPKQKQKWHKKQKPHVHLHHKNRNFTVKKALTLPLRKQQLIQPWQIAQICDQSIKLNPKINFN